MTTLYGIFRVKMCIFTFMMHEWCWNQHGIQMKLELQIVMKQRTVS